jgi:polysaccharide pyruvyl transferase WcaK-like protein
MKLGLLTTINTNIGDDFIREGLLHCIRKIAPEATLDVIVLNKHEPQTVYPRWHPIRLFDKKKIKPRCLTKPLRLLAEHFLPPLGFSLFEDCDILIQCGTPFLWQGCRNSEWARLIWRDVFARLAQCGKPLLNLGGGSCYPWEQLPETLAGNQDEAYVRLMLNSAQLTTVRDRLARKLLASLGGEVRQVCCPALLAGQAYVCPAPPTRKVLINYMTGGGHYDWGQAINLQCWEDTMRQTVRHLETSGWQPFFLAHSKKELALAANIWPNMHRLYPSSMHEYFEVVRDAAFGVCNRMHASVALAGLGIPSVAVGTDSRNLMVEALGLPVFYVKEATPDRMIAIIDYLQRNRDIESQRLLALRETTLKEYTNRMRAFFPRPENKAENVFPARF